MGVFRSAEADNPLVSLFVLLTSVNLITNKINQHNLQTKKENKMNIIKSATAISKCIAIGIIGIQMAHAGKSVTVDSISDQPEPGFTTLREAIELSNTASDVEINFDAEVFSTPQTITLENGEMLISSSMIINGPGANLLTVDANNSSRIFNLDDGTNDDIQVEISGLTLMNGNTGGPGGCINSRETLKLRSSIIKSCFAGANGGGMHGFNARDLLVENCSFLDNFSDNNGGGIFRQNGSGNSIINSTFSGNSASERGGGLAVTQVNAMDFINNTVSGNSANNGAGVFSNTSLNINNSTIVNNTGTGVRFSDGSIQNSIIAGNTDGDCVFTEIGFNNLNNFSGDGSCDLLPPRGGGGVIVDPMLGPLADNGGLTPTHLPLIGSPVIDSGDECACAQFDQRGLARPIDGDGDEEVACDIGAVEVTTLEDNDLIFIDGFEELIIPIQINENFTLIRGC